MKRFQVNIAGEVKEGYVLEEVPTGDVRGLECKLAIENNLQPKDIETENELISYLRDNNLKFSKHQAMSGSQYWTIAGKSFRISDHEQPSHYVIRQYIDCYSYNDVVRELCKSDFFDEKIFINLEEMEAYIDGGIDTLVKTISEFKYI